ncbi:MAG TPA: nuclear transport factor 2 family protein [Pseudonocardia sp.]|jgi:hypothetical protein|nr:nuclear transport factor 2 family protein [Pseudonocardia sp.]
MIDDQRLEELSAKQEIADLLLLYCRGVDRCEPDLIKRAFWPDAYDDHGAHAAPAHQFADDIVASKLATTSWTTHAVTNHLVEIDGDAAFSEAIVLTFQKPVDSEEVNVFCGRYVDRLERRGGDWRIAHRHMIHDWSGSTVLQPWALASVTQAGFRQGARRGDDFVTGHGRQELMNNVVSRSNP